MFGLVTSTVVLGLGQAVFMPFSHEAYVAFLLKVILGTILIIWLPGWFFTAGLHHQPLRLWLAIKRKLGKAHVENPQQDSSSK